METSELLSRIKGLTKRALYYLEEMGFIQPRKIQAGKVQKRDYNDEDVEKIKSVMPYLRKGFTPKVSVEKALKLGTTEDLDERLKTLMQKAKEQQVSLGFTELERLTNLSDQKIKRDLIKILEEMLKA